jgi:branched-chain amino acid transport system substrate-binding protein
LVEENVMRFRAALAIGVAAVLLGSGCTALSSGPEGGTVVIGADLELTGDEAALGIAYHNALLLKVEQVNDQGLLGDRTLRLEVRDNRSDEATGAANLTELTSDPEISAIVTGGCARCVLSSVETINGAGVPTIALAAPDAISTPVQERRYVFKLAPNAFDSAAVLASELRRAGVDTVALVAGIDDYGQDGLAAMTNAAERADIDVVQTAQVSVDGSDAPAAAAGIAAGDPDAVVVLSSAVVASAIGRSLDDAGYSGGLYLDAVAASGLFVAGEEGAALGGAMMVFTETLVIDEVIATSPAKAARKTWLRDYVARYGRYDAFASFAADAVQIVVDAINRVGSTDRDEIRTAIEGTQLDGLSGPVRITPENHSGLAPQALTALVVRGDRWRLAG